MNHRYVAVRIVFFRLRVRFFAATVSVVNAQIDHFLPSRARYANAARLTGAEALAIKMVNPFPRCRPVVPPIGSRTANTKSTKLDFHASR